MSLFRRAPRAAPPAPAPAPSQSDTQFLELRRQLVEAPDRKVMEIVELIDRLSDRGAVDGLLEPVRGRLRELRAGRRMTLMRLLFQPLDPLIVEARAWRSERPLVPRTALLPLLSTVQPALDADIPTIKVDLAAAHGDEIRLRQIGVLVWRRAAVAFDKAEMPPEWTARGLPEAAFAPMRTAIAFILAGIPRLLDMQDRFYPTEKREEALATVLGLARERGDLAWGMTLALLMQMFPGATTPMQVATSPVGSGAGAAFAATALELATGWIETAAMRRGVPNLATAADDIARQIALLDALAQQPAHKERAKRLREQLQVGCVAQFEAGLQHRVVSRLVETPTARTLLALEDDARGLRRMEREARRLGGGAGYDAKLEEVAEGIAAASHMGRFDRIRLVEILAGPAAALKANRKVKS